MLRYVHGAAVGNFPVAAAGGGAVLWNVIVNTAAVGAVVKVYDGVDATGTLVCSVDASTVQGPWYGYYCKSGIFAVMSGGNADFSLGYR